MELCGMLTTVSSVFLLTVVLLLDSTSVLPVMARPPLDSSSSIVVASDSMEEDSPTVGLICQTELKAKIEVCLTKFEQLYYKYQDPVTTDQERRGTVSRMCHQYEVTLNCLHLAFLHCPPADQHLDLMQYRIGSEQMRTFLHDTCYVAPEDMTPKPSTITTTQATTTTTTVSTTTTTEQVRSTTSDLLDLIQTSVQQESNQQSQTLSNALLESTTSSPTTTTTGLSKKQQRAHNAKLRTLGGLQPQTVSDNSKYDAEIAKEKSYIQFEIEHSQENSSERQIKAESLKDTDCSNIANRDSIKCRGITNSSHRGSVTSSVLILVAMVTFFINLC